MKIKNNIFFKIKCWKILFDAEVNIKWERNNHIEGKIKKKNSMLNF
jgi:hypothetical protein